MKFIYFIFCLTLIVSCKNETSQAEKTVSNQDANQVKALKTSMGMLSYSNVGDLDAAYNGLKNIFNQNKSISIIAELNYSEKAKSLGLELEPTQTIFFGNPNLGTPLVQANPLTALDLPQKIVYLKSKKGNHILYNDLEYLNKRYELENHQNLSIISNTLKTLIEKTSNSSDAETSDFKISKHQGIITKKSSYDFGTTKDHLLTILDSNNSFNIVAKLDHQANAKKADLEMNPSFLIIFDNPNFNTPLMQSQQSMALDLPQKMLIWENEDEEVFVSYNDIYFLQDRHQLSDNETILKKINILLDNISTACTE